MSKADYARHRRVSPGRISQLISAGRLTALVNGRVDVVRADLELGGGEAQAQILVPMQAQAALPIDSKPSRASTEAMLTEERTLTERVRRQQMELELQRQRGELVSHAEVEAAAFDLARGARDQLLAIPAQVAGELVGLTDESMIRLRLSKAFEAALRNLSGTLGAIGAEANMEEAAVV